MIAILIGLAVAAGSQCTLSELSRLPAAELLAREDAFRDTVPQSDRRRIDRLLPRNDGDRVAACASRDGAACDAAAYLAAFRAAKLLPVFVHDACLPLDRRRPG
ncbi:MAG: hypothetical protein ACRYG4_21260 [Janthinobacterium lividum]